MKKYSIVFLGFALAALLVAPAASFASASADVRSESGREAQTQEKMSIAETATISAPVSAPIASTRANPSTGTTRAMKVTTTPAGNIIVWPSITLTTPNGGEMLQKGSAHDIMWISNNVSSVHIKLVSLTGDVITLADSIPNTGSHNWFISTSTPSGTYVVSVMSASGIPVFDVSNGFITIYSPADADLNHSGKVDGADLGMLLGAWGPCNGQTVADINKDYFVNQGDLDILTGAWGPVYLD